MEKEKIKEFREFIKKNVVPGAYETLKRIELLEDELATFIDGRAYCKQTGKVWEHRIQHVSELLEIESQLPTPSISGESDWIENRIRDEYNKYKDSSHVDFIKTAALKIKANLRSQLDSPPKLQIQEENEKLEVGLKKILNDHKSKKYYTPDKAHKDIKNLFYMHSSTLLTVAVDK